MSENEEERRRRKERLAAQKRPNMKSLGRLVDSNRLGGVPRPESMQPTLPRRERPEEAPTDEAAPTADAPRAPDEPPSKNGNGTAAVADIGSGTAARGGAANGTTGGVEARSNGVTLVGEEHRDGIDRTGLGGGVTRTGLSTRLEDRPDRLPSDTLARRMIDEEIQPGGRVSDPREVPGIVLELANELPGSVAVSVVRIDEEIELVGNTIDPDFDAERFASMFTGVFRSLQDTVGHLADGPFGAVHDVVIESDGMHLVLRPLGMRYYLMVLEDRTQPNVDLAGTRARMATISPGLAATLAQQDGEV